MNRFPGSDRNGAALHLHTFLIGKTTLVPCMTVCA
jgi:hypothetical protein